MSDQWEVEFYPEAKEDLRRLDRSLEKQVVKAIIKVSTNPLPQSEGGYGKPLSGELKGLCKIKLKKIGIRVVYELKRSDTGQMYIIVIGLRSGLEVYKAARERIIK